MALISCLVGALSGLAAALASNGDGNHRRQRLRLAAVAFSLAIRRPWSAILWLRCLASMIAPGRLGSCLDVGGRLGGTATG
jgi:hypothetical protein